MAKIIVKDGKLSFFDNITENRKLAKFTAAPTPRPSGQTGQTVIVDGVTMFSSTATLSNASWFNTMSNGTVFGASGDIERPDQKHKLGLLSRISAFIKRKCKKHASQVFPLFRAHAEIMTTMKLKVETINAAIKAATSSHQTALAEKIKAEADLRLTEDRMILGGFNRCVTEAQVVEFFDKCDTDPLSLTYIANYAKPLPSDVAASLAKAEEMCLFDNYAILHFDPLGEGERLTREEEIRRRDPILFGVVRNSRKLYFIADWIDDQCKLTMEVLVDKLGCEPSDVEMKENITQVG